MAWAILFVAGLLEIGWAIGLKYTEGFTRLWPSVLTILAIIASMLLLGVAVRTIPVGTGYAVWTGIGAVGTATLGVILLGEPLTAWRVGFLAMIVCGIAGLKFTAS
jgi:quaternary ammonium compound-resistance protein SugE